MLTKKQLGSQAETIACQYLEKQGLKRITRNFRCKLGEIDLIMKDKTTLVFVEVRMRNNPFYTSALESITWHKRQKCLKTAQFYCLKEKLNPQPACRFDVIAVTMQAHKTHVQWLKSAFDLDS